MGPNTRVLVSIQVLRALAATLVLLQHAQLGVALGFGLPDALPGMSIGSAGVDVFFVISGFIMVVSSWEMFGRGRTGTFLARRWIRLVPLYWAVTAFYVIVARLFPVIPGVTYPDKMVRAAFLFWPYPMPSGAIQPIHVVGWTLNYEMFFYMLFGLALLAPRRWAIPGTIAALGAVVAAGSLLAPKAIPLVFWSNPIILEFALGMAIGAAYGAGRRLPRWLSVALPLAALAAFATHAASILQGYERLLFWGVPAAALVAGPALARRDTASAVRSRPWVRPLVALGDASYALYLVHLPVLWAMRNGVVKLGLPPATTLGAWVYLAVGVIACLAAAFATHRYFERPVTAWLKAALAWRPRRPALPARPVGASAPLGG